MSSPSLEFSVSGNTFKEGSVMSGEDKNALSKATEADSQPEFLEDESFVLVCPTAQEIKRKLEKSDPILNESNSSPTLTNATVRKLARDFAKINKKPLPGISVKLADDSNLFEWEVLMSGPADSPFAGGTFRLRLAFPNDYPTSPPKAFFYSEMFHPNVFAEDGRICVDILQNAEKWKPQYGIETVLVAVQILLGEPNPLSPANVEAGDLYQTDLDEYARRVKRIVQKSYRKLSIEETKMNFNSVKPNQLCVIQ